MLKVFNAVTWDKLLEEMRNQDQQAHLADQLTTLLNTLLNDFINSYLMREVDGKYEVYDGKFLIEVVFYGCSKPAEYLLPASLRSSI